MLLFLFPSGYGSEMYFVFIFALYRRERELTSFQTERDSDFNLILVHFWIPEMKLAAGNKFRATTASSAPCPSIMVATGFQGLSR